jgi:hypothetical protein
VITLHDSPDEPLRRGIVDLGIVVMGTKNII